MGQWTIVINGHGIHDNGRDDDADAICARFLAELAKSQGALSCTFTVGSSRPIVPKSAIRSGLAPVEA